MKAYVCICAIFWNTMSQNYYFQFVMKFVVILLGWHAFINQIPREVLCNVVSENSINIK